MNKLYYVTLLTYISVLLINSCQSNNDKKQEVSISSEKETVVKKKTIGIDTLTSVIQWRGQFINKDIQYGTLKFSKGVLVLKQGRIIHGKFKIDMKNQQITDSNYSPIDTVMSKWVIDSLMDKKYLNIEKYPVASFVVIRHFNNYIKGKLVIKRKGIIEYVENVKIKNVNGRREISGIMTIDRNRFPIGRIFPQDTSLLADEIELKIILRD